MKNYKLLKLIFIISLSICSNLNCMISNSEESDEETDITPPTPTRRYNFAVLTQIENSPTRTRYDIPYIPGLTLPPARNQPEE
jgi:hypothetical protein